jgi:hypothetical protein
MARILILVWISLAFFVVALVGSVTYVVLHGLRTRRAARSFSESAEEGLAALEAGTARMERATASLEEKSERLAAATAQLHKSRAELAVLTAAAGDLGTDLNAIRRTLPRK